MLMWGIEMGFWDRLFNKLRTQEEERIIEGYYERAKRMYGVEEE
jgi:hypothetical protein